MSYVIARAQRQREEEIAMDNVITQHLLEIFEREDKTTARAAVNETAQETGFNASDVQGILWLLLHDQSIRFAPGDGANPVLTDTGRTKLKKLKKQTPR